MVYWNKYSAIINSPCDLDKNIPSRFTNNTEANASELLVNHVELLQVVVASGL